MERSGTWIQSVQITSFSLGFSGKKTNLKVELSTPEIGY